MAPRIEFPTVFHMRITPEMKQAIIARGGAKWIRELVNANTRIPENVAPVDPVLEMVGEPAPPAPRRKVKIKPVKKTRRRVSLDKRKS